MNLVRKRKLYLFLFIALIVSLFTALVLYALRQNISLFYTPSQIVESDVPKNKVIRLGGMVVKDSVIRSKDSLNVQFQLTDFKQSVTVTYKGILPDLFREGQGIVTLGKLENNQQFRAVEVLAKHDANYMPPEVKAALAKNEDEKTR